MGQLRRREAAHLGAARLEARDQGVEQLLDAVTEGTVGLGWLPSIDSGRVAPPLPAARRCLQDLQKGVGISPQGPVDRVYAFGACDTVGLYDAALRATHGDADVSAVLAAVSAV